MSLGRAWCHPLNKKLDEASKQQFEGIEIFYEDLEYHTKALPGGLTDTNLILVASEIQQMCSERHLQIIVLQPFLHYEGLRDRTEHAKRLETLELWVKIAKALKTDVIQIPSNFLPESELVNDMDIIVDDLRQVADRGQRETPVIRFAYENLAWGTHIDTWKKAWNVVSAVDRENFGMCLDLFNITAREYADPTTQSGTVGPNPDKLMSMSFEEMKSVIDVRKIFYVQIADAERLQSPLLEGHAFYVDDQPARMSWSRNARLFPFEENGYLPIIQGLNAITKLPPEGLGYRGWVSLELFSRTMADQSPSVPADHAKRGKDAWNKLVDLMGW